MKRLITALLMAIATLAVAGHPVQALSSDPKTFISADNTFYAYVKAGETIEAAFARVDQNEPFNTTREDVTITIDGPGIAQQKCVAVKTVAIGQGCTFVPVTAQKSGIWRIQFDVPEPAKAYPEVSPDVRWGANLFSWNITVKSGSDEQHGRLWTERYALRQPAAASYATDFTYYYVSEDGYVYRAIYKGYNGQISTLSADGVGLRAVNTCESAYRSADVSDTKYAPAFGGCGGAYKLFFEEPAGNLPTKASTWEGKDEWVRPNISRPSVAELHFSSDGSSDQQSGTISFYLRNFIGQYDIKVDTDNDGNFDGQNDVVLHQQMKQLSGGLQHVRFDGTDKTGQIIPTSQSIGIKIAITKVAEIHLVAADVEGRTGGLALTRLSGDNAPTTGLCWNDTDLTTIDARLMPADVDGRKCPDSTGGVHGWAYEDGSWGNVRYIDDWVYAQATLLGSNQIAYPQPDQVAAATQQKTILPLIIIISGFVVLTAIVVVIFVRHKKQRQRLAAQQIVPHDTLPPADSPHDGQPPITTQ